MPTQFITTPITVTFETPPPFRLKPPFPAGFTWNGRPFTITHLLQEWRRDDSPRLSSSLKRSGVSKIYYRVQTKSGRVFDLYFDPTQRDDDRQRGVWVLSCEHTNKKDIA